MEPTDKERETETTGPSADEGGFRAEENAAAAARPHRRSRRLAAALALVLAATAAGAAISHAIRVGSSGAAADGGTGLSVTIPGIGTAGTGTTAADGGPANTAAIAAKVDPGLVDIDSTFSYQGAEGAGTGLVITPSGEILTNNHVVQGATRIRVTDIGNGKTYSATVVGYDPSKDIAVLQLQHASNLQTVALGNSASVQVGATVLGIGNAGGTGGTPSSAGGSITALDQSITAAEEIDMTTEQLSGLLETNAGIQPGDSGGPLVNTAGQVIGIDTAGSQNFVFQGSTTEAYAIPIDTAVAIADAIEAGRGSATVHVGATAFMGVRVEPTADEQGFGFGGFGSTGAPNVTGLLVTSVVSGEPAARAGLVSGDVITSIAGHRVTTEQALSGLLLLHHPGDSVEVGWTSGSGATRTATLTLASGPPA